jgi:hypothetical protein
MNKMEDQLIETWAIHNRINIYLISHESHHRGQVGWILKLSGRPLDQKTAFGMWEWGVR